MKRTNIVMDEDLVRQGLKATGMKTRRALVHHALEELVRREKQMASRFWMLCLNFCVCSVWRAFKKSIQTVESTRTFMQNGSGAFYSNRPSI